MPSRIVDQTESVKVDVHQCVFRLCSVSGGQRQLQAALELVAIEKPRERVMRCPVLHFIIQTTLFGDVAHDQDHAERLAGNILDRPRGTFNVIFLVIAADQYRVVGQADEAFLG